MPKETRVIYKLSDIVGIRVPCSDCGQETPIPLDFNPETGVGGTSVLMCPHCRAFGLGTVCVSLAKVIRGVKRAADDQPLLKQIRMEFKDDPAEG